MELTTDQLVAYNRLRDSWKTVGDPSPMVGSDCIMVEVTGESGHTMWLGIETDGHTHS
jgi:hypothetical protein